MVGLERDGFCCTGLTDAMSARLPFWVRLCGDDCPQSVAVFIIQHSRRAIKLLLVYRLFPNQHETGLSIDSPVDRVSGLLASPGIILNLLFS